MMLLAGVVVVAFGLFLIGLGVTAGAWPSRAERFLLGFARTARAHYAEQAVRLVVGGSLVVFAPAMVQPDLVRLFGAVLLLTTIGLLGVPWRWHRRFARWVVPPVLRHLPLFGLGAFGLGALVLYGVLAAGANAG